MSDQIQPTKYIGKIQIGDSNPVLIGSTMYGICTTDAGTATKKITTTENNSGKFINNNFDTDLQGITIHIKFTQGNTVTSGMKLLIGELSTARDVVGNCVCSSNTIISFTYDENQHWVVNDNIDTNTTYTFAESNTNGAFDVTPSGGSAQTVPIHGLTDAAYKTVITNLANNTTSTGLPTAKSVAEYVASMTGGLSGLVGAMHFRGITTTDLTDTTNQSVNSIIVEGESLSAISGDVVLYSSKEYVWTGSVWKELGDESSWALDDAVIHNSLLTSVGDMIYGAASGNTVAPARLAIGTGNNKFLTVNSGVPVWGSISKSDISNLDNVSNNDKLNSETGEKGQLIYWSADNTPARLAIGSTGKVLTVSSSGVPNWEANVATDEKVKQSPYNNGTDDRTFNILFKHSYDDTEETESVYYSTATNKLTFNPSSGVLSAAKFVGTLDGTYVLNALNYNSSDTTATFLRRDGAWKTISVGITSNDNGGVLTDVTLSAGSLPQFTQGTKASAVIDQGILILTNQGNDTFNAGSLPSITKSKANLSITQSNPVTT